MIIGIYCNSKYLVRASSQNSRNIKGSNVQLESIFKNDNGFTCGSIEEYDIYEDDEEEDCKEEWEEEEDDLDEE